MSMFHRRLLVLAGVILIPVVPMLWQMMVLTIVEHDDHLQRTQSRLVRQTLLPTSRGRILDRHGRVLARDRASFEVAFEYDIISGTWPESEAARIARRIWGRSWSLLPPEERAAWTHAAEEKLDRWLSRGLDRVAMQASTDRSEIDRALQDVTDRVERMHASLIGRRIESDVAKRREAGLPVTPEIMEEIRARARGPIAEQRRPHTILDALPDGAGFALIRLSAETGTMLFAGPNDARIPVNVPLVPGMHARNSEARQYPFDEVAVDVDLSSLPSPLRRDGSMSVVVRGAMRPVVGTMRDRVYAEDQEARRSMLRDQAAFADRVIGPAGRDLGAYRAGDHVGSTGVERSWEHTLRGLRGLGIRNLETRAESTTAPVPGTDIRLTLDVALQARIYAAMSPDLGLAAVQPWQGEPQDTMPPGTPIHGAAVVLEIDTGEILALVSTPDGSAAARDDELTEAQATRRKIIDADGINRALARPYQPGSVVKPMVYVDAVEFGNYIPGQGIVCTGHLLPGRTDVYRCWIYKRYGITHSQTGQGLEGAEAIQRSCNIFFYELGRRMGPERVARTYTRYGLGEAYDLGAGIEYAGQAEPGNSRVGISNGIFMAMGQGPVSWSPLHAADAYATLAREGLRIRPRLVGPGTAPELIEHLELDPDAVAEAMHGLKLAVTTQGGTGHLIPVGGRLEEVFNVPGVEIWGKTGTAQTSPLTYDPDGTDGPLAPKILREGEHAWFVLYAGREGEGRPRYVISVVMEYGGSGGRVSGPVVNQILHALKTEGYL